MSVAAVSSAVSSTPGPDRQTQAGGEGLIADQPDLTAQQVDTQAVSTTYRWVYFMDNLDNTANVQKAKDVMARAKKVGYNGFVLWNANVETIDRASPAYQSNLASVRNYADSLGMDFYPTVLSVGFANAMLSSDPDLIEALPVKNALFVAKGGQATLSPDPAVSLPGGSFESSTGNTFSGWDAQDSAGTRTFVDTSTAHSGSKSLKMTPGGNVVYITKAVTTSPFRQYHLSFWEKTSGVTNTGTMEPVITGENGRKLWYNDFKVSSTQDWTRYDIVFNSLGNSKVTIKLGTWGASGTFWIDDASLEEMGLTNVVRRSECPVTVRGEDGTVYTEGIDYNAISDPKLYDFQYPGWFELSPYHASPAITLTAGSRIKDGQRLRVSFYHGIDYLQGGTAISLSDPDAVSMFRSQLQNVNDKVRPDGFFFYYDEMRAGNWAQRPTPMTEGQLIATAFKREKQAANQINPNAKIFTWSDMFDPYHNAKDNYYYCNGTVDGSYNGLTSDVTIVNWNAWSRVNSMKFFNSRGNPQILAGYYDGDSTFAIKPWLADAAANNINVVGAMYTTWASDYSQLENFARDAWGGTPTVTPTPTVAPTATPKPSVTPTPTVTPAPTPKPTVTPTATPTPAPTVTPAPTAAPTVTPKPSATPTPTVTPTATPKPTVTPTPVVTPTATPKPSVTPVPTATPTATPRPTITPTPAPAPGTPDFTVDNMRAMASYDGKVKRMEQFNVAPGTALTQNIYYKNIGAKADTYAIYVTGIPATWYQVNMYESTTVQPLDFRTGYTTITPKTPGTYRVNIQVKSMTRPDVQDTVNYVLTVK